MPSDVSHGEYRRVWLNRSIRTFLLSGPMMALKATGRNLVWTFRAPRLKNPPWPPTVRSILFVCSGNICRSPFAALLADKLLRDAGIDGVRCRSAGFRTSQGASSPPEAVEAAASHGIRLQDHRPAPLTRELVTSADVVFVMEPSQVEALRAGWPAEHLRFFLLPLSEPNSGSLGAYDRCHIVDPFGRGAAEFERCYARIAATLIRIVKEWIPPGSPDREKRR